MKDSIHYKVLALESNNRRWIIVKDYALHGRYEEGFLT